MCEVERRDAPLIECRNCGFFIEAGTEPVVPCPNCDEDIVVWQPEPMKESA